MAKSIGPYRLLGELGHGGMGVVWKALDTRLQRTVAIKGILAAFGEADRYQVERFLREARAAAKLRHPNIVSVHEVGEVDGQHYLVCDYVDGEPFDARMKRGLPTREALALIRTVALALQYAHDQGIVHRDVKPSNVLIDRAGAPFVMDFGLAKDVRDTEGAALTLTGDVLGTPAYMSPEQASGNMRAVGPASDQFSLGVVLYEVLAEKKPFDGTSLRDLLGAIVESDPPRPSNGGRRVHRDLETICMKTLEKDPARRYPRMADLAEDLRRFLDGEPIEARPVGAFARAWRGVRRHKAASAGALAALAALCAALAVWRGASRRVEETAREADARRAAAEARERAVPLLQRASVLLAQAEDERWGAPSDAIERLLADAERGIAEAERTSPGGALALCLRARAARVRGDTREAESLASQAVALAPDLADAHLVLGEVLLDDLRRRLGEWSAEQASRGGRNEFRFRVLGNEGMAEDLKRLSERIRAAYERVRAGVSGILAEDEKAYGLAMEAYLSGRFVPAREGLLALLASRPGHTQAMRALGEIELRGLRRPAEAIPWFEKLRARDAASVLDLRLLAFCHLNEGRAREAEAIFSEILDRGIGGPRDYDRRGVARLLGGDIEGAIADFDRDILAEPESGQAWGNRGLARERQGDLDAAMADYVQAARLDPDDAVPWMNRGRLHGRRRECDQAIESLSRAIALRPSYVEAYDERGLAHTKLHEDDAAQRDFDEAIRLDPEFAAPHAHRADLRLSHGDVDGAKADVEKALSIDPDLAIGWGVRGRLEMRAGRLAEAARCLEHALELDEARAETHVNLGLVRGAQGDRKAERAEYDRALELDAASVEALVNRANSKKGAGDLDAARADFDEALRVDPRCAEAWYGRGLLRQEQGDPRRAIGDYDQAILLRPSFAEALNNRGNARCDLTDRERARADYDAAIAAAPGYAPPYNGRGCLRREEGDLAGAIEDFGEAIRIDPSYVDPRANRGWCLAKKGELEGAIDDFETTLRLAPRDWPHRSLIEQCLAEVRKGVGAPRK